MPNEFQFDYSANWNNTFKLGTMALAADDPQKAAIVFGIWCCCWRSKWGHERFFK